jgi:hypothetical protein
MASNQLAQCHINGLSLRCGPDQLLGLVQNGIVDIDVGAHYTTEYTSIGVLRRACRSRQLSARCSILGACLARRNVAFRWYVAVQTAAIEHEGWLPALRRSRQLTVSAYGHLFAFAILIGIISEVPLAIGRAGVTGHDT